MALLFMDSFDHYATADWMEKWTTYLGSVAGTEASGIIAGAGRRGGGALRISATGGTSITGSLHATVAPTGNKVVIGFAFVCVTTFGVLNNTNFGGDQGSFSAPCSLLSIRSGGWTHVWFKLNVDGTVSAYRPTSQGGANSQHLGTTTVSLIQAVYSYIEVAVVLDATVGSVVIRFNGNTVLNLVNQNTIGSGVSAGWNAIRLGPFYAGSTMEARYDDLYVSDGSGAAPWNDFLGDCRVEASMPTAAGANTGWTPSSGTNWQCVDDATPNDDTDYTAAATVGVTDTFVIPDLLVAGTVVYGVQHCISAKKADAGGAAIAPIIRHGGVDYAGGNLAPNTGYNVLKQIAQVNPGTGVQWTQADFNAAEFGYRRTV